MQYRGRVVARELVGGSSMIVNLQKTLDTQVPNTSAIIPNQLFITILKLAITYD